MSKNNIFQALIFTITIFGVNAFAFDCSTKEFNLNLGQVRNQSNVGWCFANTAADLLTYSHKKEIKEHYSLKTDINYIDSYDLQVSSIFMALHYFRSQIDGGANHKNVIMGGGGIQESINMIQEKGYICPYSLDIKLITTGSRSQLLEKFVLFKDVYLAYHEYLKNPKDKEKSESLSQLLDRIEKSGSFLVDYDRFKIKDALDQPTLESAVIKLSEVVCENRKIPLVEKLLFEKMISYQNGKDEYYSSNTKSVVTNRDVLLKVDEVIDNNRPLGIVYNVENVLNYPKISSGSHASVISGRKLINNECYYQIRNSWGPDCQRIAFVDGTLKQNHDIYKYNCEHGTYWVPRKDLKDLLVEIVFEEVKK